ncbi:MAG: SDR family NAD(P)-dependent oxidoreductase, partial [Hyphomicrobiales bacterium]|nr:SDR family NAD(P)-dependent oxidoreductase [Hyphomicrobiales bacterium]
MAALRHALVTGGGSGIGRAVALALAQSGIAVTVCGRKAAPLEAVAAGNPNIHTHVADITNETSVAALYEAAEGARGPFDIVVANAGLASSAPAYRTTLDDWNRVVNVNLTGAFLTVR